MSVGSGRTGVGSLTVSQSLVDMIVVGREQQGPHLTINSQFSFRPTETTGNLDEFDPLWDQIRRGGQNGFVRAGVHVGEPTSRERGEGPDRPPAI